MLFGIASLFCPVLLMYRLELLCVRLFVKFLLQSRCTKREGLLQGVHLVISLHDICHGILPRSKPPFACKSQSVFSRQFSIHYSGGLNLHLLKDHILIT